MTKIGWGIVVTGDVPTAGVTLAVKTHAAIQEAAVAKPCTDANIEAIEDLALSTEVRRSPDDALCQSKLNGSDIVESAAGAVNDIETPRVQLIRPAF